MNVTASHRRLRAPRAANAEGNERLTALTGTVLLAGFAMEGVTLLRLSNLLTLHFFLGMLLIGPVALKISSTGYRFARYYTGDPAYVRKGPPAAIPRILGPLVILSSIAVLGTGVTLALTGPGPGPWLLLHKVAFIAWFAVMSLHVLTYIWRLPRLLRQPGPGTARAVAAAARLRWLLLGCSLAAGLAIALLTVHLAGPWEFGH